MRLIYDDFANDQPAPGQRECGDCTACCKTMGVSVLNKPAGQKCTHQTPRGCAVYDDRPEACREWNCMWISDDGRVFNDDQRPDKSGLLFSVSDKDPITGVQIIYAHENYLNASQTEEAEDLIRFLRQFTPVKIIPAHQHGDTAACLTIEGAPLQ